MPWKSAYILAIRANIRSYSVISHIKNTSRQKMQLAAHIKNAPVLRMRHVAIVGIRSTEFTAHEKSFVKIDNSNEYIVYHLDLQSASLRKVSTLVLWLFIRLNYFVFLNEVQQFGKVITLCRNTTSTLFWNLDVGSINIFLRIIKFWSCSKYKFDHNTQ